MVIGSVILTQWIIAASMVLGGLIIGIIVEKIFISRIKKAIAKTKYKMDEIVIGAIRDVTIIWFVVAGLYLASHNVSLSPNVLNITHKIMLVVLILSGTWVLAKVAVGFVNLYGEKTDGTLPSSSIFANLTKVLVFLIGILVVLQSLGISITPMLTALGVGGIAVALALQETLSNLIGGFQIIASKQIRPEDFIQLDSGEEGYVVDINWRNTTLRALQNNIVIVPNSKLASIIVRNFQLPEEEISVRVECGVSYDSDLDKVEKVAIEVAKEIMCEVEGGIPEFDPVVRFKIFADSSINFTTVMQAREFSDQYLIRHEFVKRLHKRFAEVGIEIPFPIRTIYMKESRQQERR